MTEKLEKYKNFCPVPWKQFASSTDGFQRTCCSMSVLKQELMTIGHKKEDLDKCTDLLDGYYIFDQGQKLRVSDGIERYIESDSTKNIKRMLSNNMAPHQCRCYVTEKVNDTSRRTKHLKKYKINNDNDVEQFIAKTDHDIDYYDIRLGNVCNLQCLMCYPELSNQLYEQGLYQASQDSIVIESNFEIRRVDGRIVFDKDLEKKIFDWANDDFFKDLEQKVIADLSKNKDKIITFYMIGGEPLLNAPHFRFLERMVELGLSKNIELEYNTNLTVMTEEIIDLWSKFHKLILAISVDDIEDRYEYIRYPGKWSKILTNLDHVARAISQHPDVFRAVNIVAVVNCFTAYNFSKLAAVGQQFGINISKLISTGPVYTTPTILTDDEKNQYIKLITQDSHSSELVNYLNQFTFSPNSRQQFFHMLKFWDTKRRKPFAEVFPELAEILKIN